MSEFSIVLPTLFVFVVLAINIIGIFQAKGGILKVTGLIVVFAFFFTGISIFWADDATYRFDVIKPLENGWPVPFHFEPHPMQEVWEPSSTSNSNFAYSVLINFGLWAVAFFLLANILRGIGFELKPLSIKFVLLCFISLIIAVVTLNFIALKITELRNPGINYPVIRVSPPTIPAPMLQTTN